MFIRKKIVRGVVYYALVESFRMEGKVRQRVIAPLGQSATLEAAISKAKANIEFWTHMEGTLADYRHIPKQKTLCANWGDGGSDWGFFSLAQCREQRSKEEKRLALLRGVTKEFLR
jgi:hypothetical protein